MSENSGKICPFCRTEILEENAVMVCPACGIAHHQNCWDENKGCTTFGCVEQHYEEQKTNPTEVCANCGAPLGDGQAFCPRCGTAKAQPKNICANCGNEMREGQAFCDKCGHKVGAVVDNSANQAIEQFNAKVEVQKKKSKVVPIMIAAAVAVCVLIAVVVSGAMSEKKAEELKKEYIENVAEFMDFSLTAGSNLEDISDTIVTYWYENIWEDKHGSDIDDAILYAMIDMSEEITQAEEYDSQMSDMYAKIKKVPSGIADEDVDEIEDLCEAVKDLYNIYTDLYDLATDPSGNYNSYSDNNNEVIDEFLSCYRALENLMD